MAIHRLNDGPVTMTVGYADRVDGNYGPQIRFKSQDGEDLLYITESTAVRQLQRIGLDGHSVQGKTLRFEHVQKNGKTYTNINVVPGGDANGASNVNDTFFGGSQQAPVQDDPTPAPQQMGGFGSPNNYQPQQSSQQATQTQQRGDSSDAMHGMFSLYRECFDYAIDMLREQGIQKGMDFTSADVVAATATLFIQANRRR